MSDLLITPHAARAVDFPEGRGTKSLLAFLLGMAVILGAIVAGKSYAFFITFLAFSLLMTLVWRKNPFAWIFLVSVSAATPIAISKQQFACNVVFAIWFAAINTRYLFKLPKWIYVPTFLAIVGIFTSSINWMSSNVTGSLMRQGAYAFNFLLAPFLLLPVVYLRMRESLDHDAKLQGLLFYLIVPSTLILLAAKSFGSVANAWEASLHVDSLSEGFLQYKLGQVVVNFSRTAVGFILASLICSAAAVTISPVKASYRLAAGACLAINVYLLLSTGSFGSAFACMCGLLAIFYKQFRSVSAGKVLVSLGVIVGLLFLTYVLSPPSLKKYLAKRYEHRVTNADTDRFALWERGVDQLFRHPEGVGFTLAAGEKEKTFVHNDYIAYSISYGLMGGMAYALLAGGVLIFFLRRRTSSVPGPSALAVYLAGLGVIIVITINGITDHSNENRWYFNLMWSLIWYSYFCSRTERKDGVQNGVQQET